MPDQKPTLEDLLSLKKCERPTADEWAQFDERLKSKMMRKLVREPRATGRKFSAGALAPICAAALAAVLWAAGSLTGALPALPRPQRYRKPCGFPRLRNKRRRLKNPASERWIFFFLKRNDAFAQIRGNPCDSPDER